MIAHQEIKTLSIASLYLDSINPRLEESDHQYEIILKMVEEQRYKLLNLAQDIIENGLNPTDLIIAIPHESLAGKYIVAEGNRRLTAIKLLLEPSLLSGSDNKKLKSAFTKLSAKALHMLPKEIPCIVFPSREDASHWIELRHTGENEGVGIVRWSASAVARFKQRSGKRSLELQAIDFVRDCDILTEELNKKIEQISVTNLRRLLKDPHVREAIGVEVKSEELRTRLPREEVIKGLSKIITDLALKRINVNHIRNKHDRQRYIESFTKNDLPDISKIQEVSTPVADSPKFSESIKPRRLKSKRLSTTRKHLVPSSYHIWIDKPRINGIFRELKLLQVDTFPNAVSVLLRVFLEISIDEYIVKNNIVATKDQSLVNKVQMVGRFMENNGVMAKDELKPIRVAFSSQDSIFSMNTFNSYVHNPNIHPKPAVLKLVWDEFELFFTRLWS